MFGVDNGTQVRVGVVSWMFAGCLAVPDSTHGHVFLWFVCVVREGTVTLRSLWH